MGKWEVFDGKGTTRQNNKLLYQRPSFEFYDLFRGIFVEHMIYYLVKTGGDARFFPETMPVQWYAEIYDTRFKIYNVLQRRKRMVQVAICAREAHHDFHPHDLDHDGETHFTKLIARDSAMTEFTMARLMGNYILFSDNHVPVQTGMAFYKALQEDDGSGTFYSLGGDVNCLFYKPAGESLAMPDPTKCFHALADYVSMTGRRFEVGYAAALEAFTEVLETRKEGLGGCWLTVPGESTKDAFLRRLKTADPSRAIYEAYVAEHTERWVNAKVLTMDEALAEIPEIERKYKLECEVYSNVLFGMNEDLTASAKLEQEQVAKLADIGVLQTQLDNSALVAIEGSVCVKDAGAVSKSAEEFDLQKDKALDAVMATKVMLLAKS